ncbi:MAG: glucose-6-phosphate isomerase, partial [Bacteroidetes bacterium]|nr:glucose-6-phosphate isomerase [Bacteroidota bacterium]
MINLKIDITKTSESIIDSEINTYKDKIVEIQKAIKNKTGKGSDFLGWTTLPSEIDESILSSIETEAKRIKQIADVFVVIGIGGSYFGARAVIDALGHNFYELLDKKEFPTVVFAGQNLSEDYMSELLEVLDNKDYALTVISKSGTTTEPAIAFRILKNHLEEKYGKENAKDRIIAITDKEKGALKELAVKEGYKTYVVPDDVGGRYSVLTPVGLLPIAVAGFDIRKLVDGALKMQDFNNENPTLPDNPIAVYAACRNALCKKGKTIEILASYQPNLVYFTEWWKQLYGESEGKENKGIFPAGVNFTADLHSMGQYIQEGQRNIFETVISVENSKRELRIPNDEANLDSLNYL